MTTGSIEYSPDYKSEKTGDAFLPESIAKVIHTRYELEEASIERARLEREVIEAALPFANDDMDISNEKAARHRLHQAARALKEFEAQQK